MKTERKSLALAAALVAAGAAVGTFAVALVRELDPHVRLRTQHGPVFVLNAPTESGEPLRAMVAGNVYQSATYLGDRWNELPFEYYRAFDRAFEAGVPVESMLMIGGGGFAYPKHALTTHPDLRMDVVESDPAIVALALDYFYLDKLMELCPSRLHVNVNDGLSYLQETERTFDAIVNDAFLGSRPDEDMSSQAAANLVHARLNPDGMYLVNVVAYPSRADGYDHLSALVSTLESAFAHVWVFESTDLEYSDEENYLVMASDIDYGFTDAIPR